MGFNHAAPAPDLLLKPSSVATRQRPGGGVRTASPASLGTLAEAAASSTGLWEGRGSVSQVLH